MSQSIPLFSIRLDGGTQPRVELDEDVVADYAEKMASGEKMPPLVVFHDGSHYWLADGFHRLLAAKRNESKAIACDVQTGTKRDAILYAVGANAQHGLPRTNADKRRAVEMLLNDPEWSQWSDREIARRANVHHVSVGNWRRDLSGEDHQIPEDRKVQRNGTVYTQRTENIGKRTHAPVDRVPDPAPEPRPNGPVGKSRGVGLTYAHEAINALKRIPYNDGLRDEAFEMVANWINDNSTRAAA